jgi:hypothetical protein
VSHLPAYAEIVAYLGIGAMFAGFLVLAALNDYHQHQETMACIMAGRTWVDHSCR